MKVIAKKIFLFCSLIFVLINFTGCFNRKESVVIYTSMENYRLEYLNDRLIEEFPEYDITLEYLSTGNHAARLLAEGTESECDITHDLDYCYLQQLESIGILADLSEYDNSKYVEDAVVSNYFLPEIRSGGAIVCNLDILSDKNLQIPNSYDDLLSSEYKNLISMANPKASGTGFMFLKSFVNFRGEEKAFKFIDELTPNILQYTSSGSGPLNALIQGEVAVGFCMTSQAVKEVNNGRNLKILFFEEGSPYAIYGQGIIKGKEERESVKKVFDFLVNTLNYENCEKFYPEKIYKDKDFIMENYPQNIKYADMSNNTIEEKTRLLDMWKY